MAFAILQDLKKMVGHPIPLTMLTDSDSLFKIIVKSTETIEKRMIVDVRAAREAYVTGAISHVRWIRTHHNIVDGVTKMENSSVLEDFLDKGTVSLNIGQWVMYGVVEGGGKDYQRD